MPLQELRNNRSENGSRILKLLICCQSHTLISSLQEAKCVLSHSDTKGRRNYSKALDKLVTGLGLSDVGESTTTAPSYTHYTTTGESRLDRIYISPTLQRTKRRVETIVAAFKDHLAFILTPVLLNTAWIQTLCKCVSRKKRWLLAVDKLSCQTGRSKTGRQ
jgi:hypothetical protein